MHNLNLSTFPIIDVVTYDDPDTGKKLTSSINATLVHDGKVSDHFNFILVDVKKEGPDEEVNIDNHLSVESDGSPSLKEFIDKFNLWLSIMGRKYGVSINCWATWSENVRYQLVDTFNHHELPYQNTFVSKYKHFNIKDMFISKYCNPTTIKKKIDFAKRKSKELKGQGENVSVSDVLKTMNLPPKKVTIKTVTTWLKLYNKNQKVSVYSEKIANIFVKGKLELRLRPIKRKHSFNKNNKN